MRLWDTALREVVELAPREANVVSLYVCGPTPYAAPHAGHGRLLVVYDVLRRYLEWRGIEVRHVSNITDIEDNIIARSATEGISTTELVARCEAAWFELSDRLGVLRPHEVPHATDYVEKMVGFISGLVESGHAYSTSDGVYFEVARLADYGLLAHQSLESLRAGARVEVDQDKRGPGDFALWKSAKPGEPSWPSPWGDGRPGWHIECTVMALDLLGDGFDIHGAGADLIFPHNENERAQAAAAGFRFASIWLHNGLLTTEGEKMSKSLGNVSTLDDLLGPHDPRSFRLAILRTHYRSPIEVTPEVMADTSAALQRLDAVARRFPSAESGGAVPDPKAVEQFVERMDEDLDSPGAVAVIFDAARRANASADSGDQERAAQLAAAVRELSGAVGITFDGPAVAVDAEASALVEQRDAARAAKDYGRADEIKRELESRGWIVEDFPTGTEIRPA